MTRWGAGPVGRQDRRNHGSRDPIRVYLEDRRRYERRQRVYRVAAWLAIGASAVIMAIVVWMMLVVILSYAP